MSVDTGKSTESIVLIWIGNPPPKKSKEDLAKTLKIIYSHCEIYEDKFDEKFFSDSQEQLKAFVILNQDSKLFKSKLLERLENASCVQFIWILLAKPNLDKKAPIDDPKSISRVNYIDSFNENVIMTIRKYVRQAIRQKIDFNMFDDNVNQKTTRDLNRDGAMFLWFQILLDILKEMNTGDFAKQEMVTMCREYYEKLDDHDELENIRKFNEEYKKEDAIHWYTDDSFLHKLLNKALRTEDIHSLYRFRLFIVDLCEAIQNIQKELLEKDGPKIFKLYRGQFITKMELSRIRQNTDKLISTNGFFSTTSDESIAKSFISDNKHRDTLVPVLFEIEAKSDLKSVAFADIKEFSKFKDEFETLFSLGAVFKINQVKSEKGIHVINMIATDEGRDVVEKYREICKKDLEDNKDTVVFGRLLMDMGQYQESMNYFDDQIEFMKKAGSAKAVECAPFYHNKGRVHACMGELKEALDSMRIALDIRQKNLLFSDPDIGQTYNSIGIIEGEMGQYANAKERFQKALEIFEPQKKGDSNREANLHWATTKTNIAWIDYLQGDYEQSRNHQNEALTVRIKFLTNQHVLIADNLSGLGALHHAKGEYEKANELFQKALDLRMKTLPPNHIYIANSYQCLGAVELEYGRYNDALTYYKRAADILNGILKSDHILIAMSEKAIGNAYLEKGEYDKALEHFHKALEISSKALSGDHPTAGECHYCKGIALERKASYQEAMKSYREALRLVQAAVSTDHPSVARIQCSIASVCLRLDDISASEKYLKSCEDIQRKNYANHPDLVLTLNNLGVLYTRMKTENVKAEKYLQEALAMCKICFSESHLANSRTLFNLGELYTQATKYDQAIKYYDQALDIRRKALPTDDISLVDIYSVLGYVHFQKQDYPKAERNYIKAVEIYKKKYSDKDKNFKRTEKNLELTRKAIHKFPIDSTK